MPSTDAAAPAADAGATRSLRQIAADELAERVAAAKVVRAPLRA